MALACEPLCHFGGRLYFTSFPNPPPRSEVLNRLAAEPDYAPRIRGASAGSSSSVTPDDDAKYYYFTIDDQLLYLSFFQDWGPLNLAMVYKACILIHELLQDQTLSSHRLVLYSSNDPRRKANAALLMALYVMIVQQRPPWEAFHPIAEIDIQDCLWGIYKAMQNGLCDMNEFDVEEYEYYEKVENGDWNWLTPNFIAFASPVDPVWIKREREKVEEGKADASASPPKPTTRDLALQRKLPATFLNCLDYFEKSNIRLVVRLNNPLYDRQHFLDRGISHQELYFDDGTNPTDEIVRKFIDMADEVVEAGGVVAIHCKAGLGRTGTLVGAYLIWKYGFTASEAIAFMRIARPGCVVGPQQQYMYLKQLEWCKWSAYDEVKRIRDMTAAAATAIVAPATPPAEDDRMDVSDGPVVAPSTTGPVPPPRKTPIAKRVASDSDADEEGDVLPALGVAPAPIRRKSKPASARPAGVRGTASEQRPTRVTRSAAGTAVIRRPGGAATALTVAKSVKANGQAPNKIPRLANGTSVRGTKEVAKEVAAASSTTRKLRNPPSPIPSRLPTLVAKRAHHNTTSVNELPAAAIAAAKSAVVAAGAWMTTNAAAVVSKEGRPNLRPIRRRRSSFSAADVVA
ncbi:protein-tyrosine phosphatase-like protein [Fomitopsis serialis]|uniref:protein-tyrosine phosphatase-like protein n=1 Tax=Fomitopsis serialis TaxID=139415 RepID=UPI0020073FAB|nr:protein-tyrosine phosphatase-like protein [Neoantrodia serialis]KAH9938664.1 protein-tyrosine phosphatase-like protein [Neoantrodia serialis]